MQRLLISPKQYHTHKFDPSRLPDLVAAGPVSASILSKSRDPLKFLTAGPEEMKSTAAIEWGSLVDMLWLTPEKMDEDYIALPADAPQRPTQAMLDAVKSSPSSQARKDFWALFDQRAGDRVIVEHEDLLRAHQAIRMLETHLLANEIWHASEKQVVLMGDSPIIPGTKAKCMMDLLPITGPFSDAVVDFKSTYDTDEHQLQKTMRTFDYTIKLGYYGILAEAAGFGPRPRGILIWQASSLPFDVHVREIDPVDMRIGRQVAINRYHALAAMDKTHLERHYDTALGITSLPEWAREAMLQA
jgi:hypothetical protein